MTTLLRSPSRILALPFAMFLFVATLGGCIEDEADSANNGGFVDDGDDPSSNNGDDPSSNNGTSKEADLGDLKLVWKGADTEVHQELKDWLQATELMESIVDWLNEVFALPIDIDIILDECGQANAFWDPNEQTITMCYELLPHILNAFYSSDPEASEEKLGAAVSNTWVFILFHELGHGLADVYDLPITGQEEDAVDDFSTVVLVAIGWGIAAVDAAYFWYLTDQGMADNTALADEHSLNLQRMYNIVCLVYGSDPEQWGWVLDVFPDIAARAPRCSGEFSQKINAWDELLEPWFKE
jgi:hypothetical protein